VARVADRVADRVVPAPSSSPHGYQPTKTTEKPRRKISVVTGILEYYNPLNN